ncbi:MAG: alkaline phosphatase PhoX [Candidatus Aminicenantales bacterium]
MKIGRRRFLERSGVCLFGAAVGAVGRSILQALPEVQARAAKAPAVAGFGPLRRDPENLLDLPAGFSYRIVSAAGKRMEDGFIVPSLPDGSAAFPGPNGTTLLLRNHEFRVGHADDLGPFGGAKKLWKKVERRLIYDWRPDGTPCLGSVTTVVYDTKRKKTISQHLSLAGTMTNCSGGPTPWGTWLSSEEVFMGPGEACLGRHGYTYEVPVSASPGLAPPVPLKALGRFEKEGLAVDPRTGIVYQTEDLTDGLFYRFLPSSPGRLAEGGRLQALAVAGKPGFETNNWRTRTIDKGRVFDAAWIDLEATDPDEDVLRLRGREKGAAVFAGGEGLVHHNGTIIFACTNGGTRAKGQVWRYVPGPGEGTPREADDPGRLELLAEPDDDRILDHPDQITVAPWGDLFVCEDGDGDNFVVGLTPRGEFYKFARLAPEVTEPSGICFSPDRTTMFLNDLPAGLTFAVTGPWT